MYKVQTSNRLEHARNQTPPIKLLTPTALKVGQLYQQGATFLDRIIAEVKSQTNNGFQVTVISPNPPF